MKPVRATMFLLIGALLLAACSSAGTPTSTGPSVEELAATIAAATINAAQATRAAATPPTPVATATVKPTLFINAASSSCRSGPGNDFRIIATFSPGTSVDLVGRNNSTNYWIVRDPGSGNLCWIQVQDATPGGSFDDVPEMTAEPVTVTVPNQPGSYGSPNFACDNSSLTVILAWAAPAGQVNGYRVYRAGTQVADVPANETSYKETIPFVYGSTVQYSVAAYNDAGTSPQRNWTIHCVRNP